VLTMQRGFAELLHVFHMVLLLIWACGWTPAGWLACKLASL